MVYIVRPVAAVARRRCGNGPFPALAALVYTSSPSSTTLTCERYFSHNITHPTKERRTPSKGYFRRQQQQRPDTSPTEIQLGGNITAVVQVAVPQRHHHRSTSVHGVSEQQYEREELIGRTVKTSHLPVPTSLDGASEDGTHLTTSTDIFQLPRSVEEARHLISTTSLLRTLRDAEGVSSDDVEVACSDVDNFVTVALPILLSLRHRSDLAESGGDVAAAQRSLCRLLHWIQTASHSDGRRHVQVLPPPLVAVLWNDVMPALHQYQHAARDKRALVQQAASSGPGSILPATKTSSADVASNKQQQTYTEVRRALALHTRAMATLFPVDILALVLTRMHQGGALADDVLGHMLSTVMAAQKSAFSTSELAAGDATQTVGGTIAVLRQHAIHQVIPQSVVSQVTPALSFTGSTAITVARLLGRIRIPGHHQLHTFFHTVLLPEVTRELKCSSIAHHAKKAEELPVVPRAALRDLTSSFRHYAVSGEAVVYLTTLWAPHIHSFGWNDCTELLRQLSWVIPLPQKTIRRQAQQNSYRKVGAVADEDYYPLSHLICSRVSALCKERLCLQTTTDEASAGVIAPTTAADNEQSGVVTAVELLNVLSALLRVNSLHWAETYQHLADVISITTTDIAAWPLEETARALRRLLHRNTLIPDHEIHRLLVRRLLHSPEALTDPKVAGTALLSLELMIPEMEGMPPLPPEAKDGNTDHDGDGPSPHSHNLQCNELTTATAAAAAELQITSEDRACALQIFRRHGRNLTPGAFVAGLSVVPLQHLPVRSQTTVINHLSSVASAVHPNLLIKAMNAVITRCSPTIVDEVSVQRWFSRFTAVDVVRRVDLGGCATLLHLLSLNPNYERNSSIAKATIVRQIGIALRRADDSSSEAASLEALPHLVRALHRGRVFFASLFSRICRLLLSQVEHAPLAVLLPSFAVVADEFMRRRHGEAEGSVFRDVWELLRRRVMDAAATSLTEEETLAAINAFAALDVADRPLFSMLLQRYWELTRSSFSSPTSNSGDGSLPNTWSVDTVDSKGSAAQAEEEEQQRQAQLRAGASRHLLQQLSPSAVVVLAAVLLPLDSTSEMAATLLPWVLIGLHRHQQQLYPVEVVYLLPHLLNRMAAHSVGLNRREPAAAAVEHHILHDAYDCCRQMFLRMYEVLPSKVDAGATPAASPDTTDVSASPVEMSAWQQEVAAQRTQWPPATRVSVHAVPPSWFIDVLMALSNAEMIDNSVAVASAARAARPRVCGGILSIQQLVDLCLSMCWSLGTSTATEECTNTAEREHAAAVEVTRPLMAIVLSALWNRTDELSMEQAAAILRCLRYTFGESKVDKDFAQRLEAQMALTVQRQQKQKHAALPKRDTASLQNSTASIPDHGSNHDQDINEAIKIGSRSGVNEKQGMPVSVAAPMSLPALLPSATVEMSAAELFDVM